MLHLLARETRAARLIDRLAAGRDDVRQRITAHDYGRAIELPDAELGPGPWVFLDLDRLDDDSAFAVMQLRARLARRPGVACWNHPTRTLHRFELFRLLHDAGAANGDVYRLEDRRPPRRWPVFLHDEFQALSDLPELIDGPQALVQAVQRLGREGRYRPGILIREAPGLERAALERAAGEPVAVRMVLGRPFVDAAGRERLTRAGAAVPAGLVRLLAGARVAVGSLLLLPTPGVATVLDAGTDPLLFALGPEPGPAVDALLALDTG